MKMKLLQVMVGLLQLGVFHSLAEAAQRPTSFQRRPRAQLSKTSVSTSATSPPVVSESKKLNDIDLDREIAHMESYDSYVLVSVLTATISFTTLLSFGLQTDLQHLRRLQALKFLLQIVASLSTLCGLYATVVFSLTI